VIHLKRSRIGCALSTGCSIGRISSGDNMISVFLRGVEIANIAESALAASNSASISFVLV